MPSILDRQASITSGRAAPANDSSPSPTAIVLVTRETSALEMITQLSPHMEIVTSGRERAGGVASQQRLRRIAEGLVPEQVVDLC